MLLHIHLDPIILAEADETHPYLSNGDDGYGLVYGSNPEPVDPVTGGYVVLDFIGDWNGDPGSGWTVAGVADATMILYLENVMLLKEYRLDVICRNYFI